MSQRLAEQQGKGLRLKLRIKDLYLSALPWEFLFDPRNEDFICLSRERPLIRYLELPLPVIPLASSPPLRVLGVIASPADLPPLKINREKQRIESATNSLKGKGLMELTWLEGRSWRDLQRALQEGNWQVLHFIGHGGFNRQEGEGYIALCGEEEETYRLRATELGRLLADHRSLRLVILNSCEGARGSLNKDFSSTASTLIRRGIPAVIAMQYEITDQAAIEFSRSFYESLTLEFPIDAAVAEARKAVCLAIPGTMEWGTPVLYMRSREGQMFDFNQSGLASPKREPVIPPKAAQLTLSNIGSASYSTKQKLNIFKTDKLLSPLLNTVGVSDSQRHILDKLHLSRKLGLTIWSLVALTLLGLGLYSGRTNSIDQVGTIAPIPFKKTYDPNPRQLVLVVLPNGHKLDDEGLRMGKEKVTGWEHIKVYNEIIGSADEGSQDSLNAHYMKGLILHSLKETSLFEKELNYLTEHAPEWAKKLLIDLNNRKST